MTRDFPTIALIFAISSSTNLPGVQLGSALQMLNRKFEMISRPRGVCATSGWNCTQWMGLVSCRIPAIATVALDAVTR